METEKEKNQEILNAFFKYAKENELSAFDTPSYFAKQILPRESFFLKTSLIGGLIESGIMVIDDEKWLLKDIK